MRQRTTSLLLALAGVAAACTTTVYEPAPEAAAPPAEAPVAAPAVTGGISFFYDSLAPYGSWITVASYGQVWAPRVNPWWRPYTEGRWVYTDDGWTWDSSEPFGWATFHYGRWFDDPAYGWVWVPGTVWGPAWVAWRSGGGHIGWAPLPPSIGWQASVGFSGGGVNFAAVIAPTHWCFVDERYMTAPAVREYVAPRARNVTFVNVTNNITNYTVVNNRIVDNSVNVNQIERVTRQPVPRFRIVDRTSPTELRGQDLRANELPMVRAIPSRPNAASSRVPAGVEGAGVRGREPATLVRGNPVSVRESRTAPAVVPAAPPATAHIESVTTINQRYDAEKRALAAHQAQEQLRLERERAADPRSTAAANRQRYLDEEKVLAQEHKRDATILANRHKLEVRAAKKASKQAHKPVPPPKRRTEKQ